MLPGVIIAGLAAVAGLFVLGQSAVHGVKKGAHQTVCLVKTGLKCPKETKGTKDGK